MSRVGLQPVQVPANVKVEVTAEAVRVTGPKGDLSMRVPVGVTVAKADGQVKVAAGVSSKGGLSAREISARHGLTRALIRNMVEGVTNGYERTVELQGAGYRPQVQGETLTIALGFSHPITIKLPAGIKASASRVEGAARGEERHRIVISGCDKVLVGEIASSLRRIKPADVYKGKGVRYAGEIVRRKPGKSAVAGGTGGK